MRQPAPKAVRSPRTLLAAPLALLASCNSGLVGVVSGGDDSSNAPATISALTFDLSAESPAQLRFRLTDPESDQVAVELYYRVGGGAPRLLTQLSEPNPGSYASAPEGVEHPLSWDFAAEPDLPDDAGFTPAVQVYALIDGVGNIVPGANAATVGLGNDAPVVTAIEVPAAETALVVPVPFELEDTSSDLVGVRVEFDVLDSVEDWQLARPAGLDSTPALAFENVLAKDTGAEGLFFWDTLVDLANTEQDVQLRFTPLDALLEGEPVVSAPFRVDNNEAPVALVDDVLFSSSNDRRRGIRVPLTLADAESDELLVSVQWREPGESFPALPCAPCERAEIEALLADPEQRRALQLGRPYARVAEGRVVPVDGTSVRLPDLGVEHSWASKDVVGSELEILRGSARLQPAPWGVAVLDQPIDLAPLGDGLTALVLDHAGGGWRVRELELASGETLATVATGAGLPRALGVDRDERFLFVAAHTGDWNLMRFDLSQTPAAPAGSVSGSVQDPGGVRDLVVESPLRALLSLDDQIVRANFTTGNEGAAPLANGLATPWGLALDPLLPDQLVVALHGENRIALMDLTSGSFFTLPGLPPEGEAGAAWPAPRSILLEDRGRRLLAVVEAADGTQLRARQLREPADTNGDGLGDPRVVVLEAPGLEPQSALAGGADGLRCATLPLTQGLLIGDGLLQRRNIVGYELASQTVSVDAPFSAALSGQQRWRIPVRVDTFDSSPQGTPASYLWNSLDVDDLPFVHLQVLAFDSEQGLSTQTSLPRELAPELVARDATYPGGDAFSELAAGDLDNDGDIDLISSGQGGFGTLLLYEQEARGEFSSEPQALDLPGQGSVTGAVFLTDMDGDGQLDLLLSADLDGDFSFDWSIFLGAGDGSFSPAPLLPLPDSNVFGVAPADLDGDGQTDLAYWREDEFGFALQSGGAQFESEPVSQSLTDVTAVIPTDWDGDGQRELVCRGTSTFEGMLQVYELESGGLATSPTVITPPNPPFSISAQALRLVDLDANGAMDIIHLGVQAPAASVHFADADGLFLQDPVLLAPEFGGFITVLDDIDVADLDGNGRLDVAVTGLANDEHVKAFLQSTPGGFSGRPLPFGNLGSGNWRGPLLLDFDGNGAVDIAMTAQSVGLGVSLLGLPATFEDSVEILQTEDVFVLAGADLNRDGGLDLIAREAGFSPFAPPQMRAYTQLTPANYSPAEQVLGASTFLPAFDLGDLNGDGELDYVQGIPSPFQGVDGLQVNFGQGAGQFSPIPTTIQNSDAAFPMAQVVDMDGDGSNELFGARFDFVPGTAPPLLGVWELTPSGELALLAEPLPGVDLGGLFSSESNGRVRAVDIDGDADLDVVALLAGLEGANNRLMVVRQIAPLVYEDTPQELDGFGGFLSLGSQLEFHDLDRDGLLEIIYAPSDSTLVAVYAQSAPGVFEPNAQLYDVGGTQLRVLPLDVDEDGDVDLVADGIEDTGKIPLSFCRAFIQLEPGVFDPVPLDVEAPLFVRLDADGDGDLDAVFGGSFGVPNQVLFGKH